MAGLSEAAFDRLAQASWGWTWCDALQRVDLSDCPALSAASFQRLAMVRCGIHVRRGMYTPVIYRRADTRPSQHLILIDCL